MNILALLPRTKKTLTKGDNTLNLYKGTLGLRISENTRDS